MNTASLIRRYGKGRAWDRAGLYFLDPPLPQIVRDGTHEQHKYVMVMVQGDSSELYAADHNGTLRDGARWYPLTHDDMTPRGVRLVDNPSCTAALEAEGYTVVPLGEVTA